MVRPTSIPAPAGLLVLALAAALFAPIHDRTPKADAQALTYRHVDLTLTDTLGGAVTGVAIDAGTGVAYVSRGARVEALDVSSDPTGPTLLATSERLAGVARVLGAAGGRVFVAVQGIAEDGTTIETLIVLASAEPATRMLPVVGEIATSAKEPPSSGRAARIERAFAADGSTAYLVATAALRVVKVIDLRAWPATSEADVTLAADVNGIVIAGATLVAATDGGVSAIDVADPAAPVVRGELALRWGADGVAVDGTTAYATTGDGLAAVDIGDAAHLVLRGPLDEACAEGAAVVVARGRVWVTRPERFRIPSSVLLCGLEPDGAERRPRRESWEQRGMAGSGGTLVVADGSSGLVSLRPATTEDDGIDTVWWQRTLGDAAGVADDGGVMRVVDTDREIWSFDATEPAAPRPLGHADVQSGGGFVGSSAGLTMRGRIGFLAYVGNTDAGGSAAALDFAAPDHIDLLGEWTHYDVPEDREAEIDSYYNPTNGYGPYSSGTTLFLTGDTVPLTALDVTDPAAPRWLGRFGGTEPYHGAGGLALDGSRAWIALLDQGIGLLDLAVPTAPKLIDQIQLPGYTQDVARVGGHVLAVTAGAASASGDGPGALAVIDVATRLPIAYLPSDVPWYRLVVQGTRAILYGDGIVAVVDVRDPANPVEVGRVRNGDNHGWYLLPLAVVGDTVWVGAGDLGVSVYRLTEGDAFTPPPPADPPGTLTPEPPHTPWSTPTVRAWPSSTVVPGSTESRRAYLPYGLTARP